MNAVCGRPAKRPPLRSHVSKVSRWRKGRVSQGGMYLDLLAFPPPDYFQEAPSRLGLFSSPLGVLFRTLCNERSLSGTLALLISRASSSSFWWSPLLRRPQQATMNCTMSRCACRLTTCPRMYHLQLNSWLRDCAFVLALSVEQKRTQHQMLE